MTSVNCEWVRNYLPLFLYHELSFEEEETLQTHLTTCVDCQAALETERHLHAALDCEAQPLAVGLLNECRAKLATQLAAKPPTPATGWLERLRAWCSTPQMLLRPAGGFALIAVGFFGARLLPPATPDSASPFVTSVADPVATRVRRVEPSGTGQFQIVLDETRQRIVTGSAEDEPIRQMLISATTDPSDPALRGETIEILSNVAPCDQTRQALLQAAETDSNDGVRLRALQGLKPLAHQSDVRRVLARVLLKDPNAGVRTQAIDLLTQNQSATMLRENEVIGVFQDLMGREQNHYIRMQAQRQLRQVKASTEVY